MTVLIALALCALALSAAEPASAQTPVSRLLGLPTTEEVQPKRLLEEMLLYGYLENSYVINLRHASPHNVNDLRFYDHDADYSWNALELSVKKDPSERYPWGFGVVTTAGMDSRRTTRSASSGTSTTGHRTTATRPSTISSRPMARCCCRWAKG